MKKFLIFTFMIIIISIASASIESMKPAKLHENYTIIQTCSNCSFLNMTLSNNEGVILENVGLTDKGGGNWVYYFTPQKVGRYDLTGIGDLDGVETSYATYFEVTGDGFQDSGNFYFLIFGISFIIILVGIWLKDPIMTLIGSFGLYFIGLYILFNGITGIKDPTYTWGIGILILGLAFYISAKSSMEML